MLLFLFFFLLASGFFRLLCGFRNRSLNRLCILRSCQEDNQPLEFFCLVGLHRGAQCACNTCDIGKGIAIYPDLNLWAVLEGAWEAVSGTCKRACKVLRMERGNRFTLLQTTAWSSNCHHGRKASDHRNQPKSLHHEMSSFNRCRPPRTNLHFS